MWALTTEECGKPPSTARRRSILPQQLKSLQDLLNAIKKTHPDQTQLVAMLGTTAGHICLHLGEPPSI